jgi:hypothetical protein
VRALLAQVLRAVVLRLLALAQAQAQAPEALRVQTPEALRVQTPEAPGARPQSRLRQAGPREQSPRRLHWSR